MKALGYYSRMGRGRVAYAVVVHAWPAQVGRLVSRLLGGGAAVAIHLDARASLHEFEPYVKGAVLTHERVAVRWAGFSLAKAMLLALEQALLADPEATHIQWLSGQDYPCRSEHELLQLLAAEAQISFVDYYPLLPGTQFDTIPKSWCFRDQYALLPGSLPETAHRFVDKLNRRLPDRVPPFPLWRGSAWSCLARPSAELLLRTFRNEPSLRRYFRTINVPDEILPQTVLANSALAPTLVGWGERDGVDWLHGNLHYIDWTAGRENPAVLDHRDLPAIEASGAYFLRKVDPTRSAQLMHLLDEAATH